MGEIRADAVRPGECIDLSGRPAKVTAVEIDGTRVRIRVDLPGGMPFALHTSADTPIATVEEGR